MQITAQNAALFVEMYEGQLKYLRTKMQAARRAYNGEAISAYAAEISEVKACLSEAKKYAA